MTVNNNNHRKSSCEFAEESLAFLYGEGGSDEKTRFEAHVESCPVCADEVAAFGFVRSSIQEWRDEVFADLATPEIVIPYPTAAADGSVPGSWFETITRMFGRMPMLGTAATAFAVLAVCLGIVLAIAYYPGSDQVAETPSKPDVERVSPNTEETAGKRLTPETGPASESGTPAEIAVNSNVVDRPLESGPNVRRVAEKSSNNKAGSRVRPNVAAVAKNSNQKPKSSKSNSPNIDEMILSNYSADEEESIRLADLFDEVGSKK